MAAVLASVAEMEQMRRWWIVLHGARRLRQVAALREQLLRVPFCVAARVTDLSSDVIALAVTTTARVDRPYLEDIVAEALQQVGCLAEAEVLVQPPAAAG